MDYEEFCAATLSVHQLEALDRWEQHARSAYEFFEKDGNRAIVIDELASVCWIFFPLLDEANWLCLLSCMVALCVCAWEGKLELKPNTYSLNGNFQLHSYALVYLCGAYGLVSFKCPNLIEVEDGKFQVPTQYMLVYK